jgi:autotransporter-associated beta strand protein
MKALPVLTLSLALAASFPASAASLMFDFGNPTANTSVPETNTSTPGPVASGGYLTLSPGHATGEVAPGETTWNTITASSPRSDLSYSDGTSATGVTLTLGQEAVAGDNAINFSTAISTLNLLGNGGGTAGRQSLLFPGSIYGDSRLGSSAVGRDGFFGGAGSAIGFRVDGLAAGHYIVYLMGRNTNSNATTLGGMTFYATSGPSSGTFANFNSAASGFEVNATYTTAAYAGQYASFAAGENYVALNVTVVAGQSLFVAVDGIQQELRGFLNMAQITPSPKPFAWSKGDGDWDTASFNWNTDSETYAEPARVTFPTLVDAGDGINTVNLSAGFSPNGVNITNTGDFDTTAYAFTGSGSIAGSTGITKSGSGIARFSNTSNSYSGALSINAGAVIKDAADNTTGAITVASGGTFALAGGITDGSGQTITIAGTGNTNLNYFYTGSFNQRGALQAQGGDNTWAGNIVLSGVAGTGGTTRIGVQNGSSLTLTGTISEAVAGMSPYFRAGDSPSDVITLAGTCSWTGPTRIYSNGGIVTISADDKLPTAVDLIVGTSAGQNGSPTFDLAGFDQTVGGLSGVGGTYSPIIKNSGEAQSTLTLNPSVPSSFPGIIQDDVKLIVGGTAAQTLSGDNTQTADTIINSGANLIIADTGELQFYPTTNGITNSVGGAGTLQYDGTLRIDTSGTDSTPGNSWVVVNVGSLAPAPFGATFAVTGSSGNFAETEVDSGIWKMAAAGREWTFTESTGTLSVAAHAGQPFDTWISAHFPGEADPALVGKTADPDGDGSDNLAEFALNGNPDDGADNGYQVVAIEDTNANTQKELTLTIAVRKAGGSPIFAGSPLSATSDGVKYTIEGSVDLVFPSSAVSEGLPAAGPGGLPSDYEYRRFRLDASEGLTGKGFLRVKTEPAP